MSLARILLVTDPMCSWCWGMSAAVEETAHAMAGEVTFDLLLGGINTHASQPVGEYGRRHLLHIWREVQATTGQDFGMVVPAGLIYNSTLACIAIEAVRRRRAAPPFGFLHRLQQCLFVEGWDISKAGVQSQFASSRIYGTNALPSVLIEQEGRRRLLLGGYADSSTMIELIRTATAPNNQSPAS